MSSFDDHQPNSRPRTYNNAQQTSEESLPRFSFEYHTVFGSAPQPSIPPPPGYRDTDSISSFYVRRDTEPVPNNGIDAEARANPRYFGFIGDPDEGSQIHLIEPTPVTTTPFQYLPGGQQLNLLRSNAIRRFSRTSAERERGPPKMQTAKPKATVQKPRKKTKDEKPMESVRNDVVRHMSRDGKTTHVQIHPIKIDYQKAAPSRTPSLPSGTSELSPVSPLLPRTLLAQEWEEARQHGKNETRTFDDIITNRVRCHTWASEVQPAGDDSSVSPLTPSPIWHERRRQEKEVLAARNQLASLEMNRQAEFEAMREPAATDSDRLGFLYTDSGIPAFVPTRPAPEPLMRPRGATFDAARLTRKVFGVHMDSANSQTGSTRNATQDTLQPAALRDTTNVRPGGLKVDSEDQMMKDAFGSSDAQAMMRKGRSRSELLHTLPRLDTETPARKPLRHPAHDGLIREQNAPAYHDPKRLDHTRQAHTQAATPAPFRQAVKKASTTWAEKLKQKAGIHKRISNESDDSTDKRPATRSRTDDSEPEWLVKARKLQMERYKISRNAYPQHASSSREPLTIYQTQERQQAYPDAYEAMAAQHLTSQLPVANSQPQVPSADQILPADRSGHNTRLTLPLPLLSRSAGPHAHIVHRPAHEIAGDLIKDGQVPQAPSDHAIWRATPKGGIANRLEEMAVEEQEKVWKTGR